MSDRQVVVFSQDFVDGKVGLAVSESMENVFASDVA